ncbi:MAG: PAS domain S-box protein [Cyanobacteria bacterium P01_G01_bin.39]
MTSEQLYNIQDVLNITEKKRTVMLVEDSAVDRAVYQRYLKTDRKYNYTFIETETGSEALEIYPQYQPDLILLDYLLPDINGLNWFNQWQNQYSGQLCPVIILTGQGDENIAVQFIKLGAANYLLKSQITPERLRFLVRKEIAFTQLQQDKQNFTNTVQSQAQQLQTINNLLEKQIAQCEISNNLIRDSREQLQKSEAKFYNTFEQAAVGMAHVALDGKWLIVNQKLAEIVGYSKAELLQKTFQDITHPEDLDSDFKCIRQILAGEIDTCSMDKRYICKDRSLIWIHLTVSLVNNLDGEPEYFIAVIENISDRRKLELAQQKTLQHLSNLHQIDKAILSAQDPQAIGKIAVESIQQFLDCQRTCIVTFDPEENTATILISKDQGQETLCPEVEVSLDIWQDLIHKLQNKEKNYIITSLSQLTRLSRGISTLTTLGLSDFICFPLKGQNDKLLGILNLWVEDLATITREELTIVNEISIQVAIAFQQANWTRKIQNHALDLENKVLERTAQLEEINQELKDFSYSVSHDLKAPLRAIQGFAIALQEDYVDCLDELGHEYTKRLAVSAQQMEKLINDLLSYSRLSRTEINRHSVSLISVVAKALEELDSQITSTQAQITIDQPLLSTLGNRTIVLQIISNLLSNALKFMADGVQPQIHIWSETHNNFVRLWIEDNGIGIDRQHRSRIFNVFERLHGNEAYPGTGIGLAIVKKGIERLGGRFGVESELDRGSRFWIELSQINVS